MEEIRTASDSLLQEVRRFEQEHELIQILVELNQTGIFVTDYDGAIIHVNEPFKAITGISESTEDIRRSWLNIISDWAYRKIIGNFWDKALKTRKNFCEQVPIFNRMKEKIWVLVRAYPTSDGRYVGSLEIIPKYDGHIDRRNGANIEPAL